MEAIIMPLNKYQKICYRWFGHISEPRVSDRLKHDLQASHMNIRAGAYLSFMTLNSILSSVVTFIAMSIIGLILLPVNGVNLDTIMIVFFVIFMPALAGLSTYFVGLRLPSIKAKGRGRQINHNLAYALNFISAMSSAGVTPTEIFNSLSKQDIYGEIKEEASWIYRDVALLGTDIISAIKANIERTPSMKFKEFSQGMIVTVSSGGSLKSYFMAKANQYLWENRQGQKQLLESLGIMAESYVTAAVAGILLLLIVIPLMMIISGDFNATFLYVLIFMIVPLIHIGFSVVIKSMSQGV
jgi:flagellar protein FlaJ